MMHHAHTSLSCDIACNIYSVVQRRLLKHMNLRSMRTTSQGGRFAGERGPRKQNMFIVSKTKYVPLCCRGSNVTTSQGFALSGPDCMARPMLSLIGSDAFKILGSDACKMGHGGLCSRASSGAPVSLTNVALKRSTHTSMVRDRAVIRQYHSVLSSNPQYLQFMLGRKGSTLTDYQI